MKPNVNYLKTIEKLSGIQEHIEKAGENYTKTDEKDRITHETRSKPCIIHAYRWKTVQNTWN